MTPEDVPGLEITAETLFPWLAAIAPAREPERPEREPDEPEPAPLREAA